MDGKSVVQVGHTRIRMTAVGGLVAALAAIGLLLAGLAGPAHAESRGYELVTPADDAGYTASFAGLDPAGDRVYWWTRIVTPPFVPVKKPGINLYGATRDGSGWAPSWLTPFCPGQPSAFDPDANCGTQPVDTFVAGAGGRVVFSTVAVITPGETGTDPDLFLGDDQQVSVLSGTAVGTTPGPGGVWTPVNVNASASQDLSTVVFVSTAKLVPEATDGKKNLFLRNGDGLRMLTADDDGHLAGCPGAFSCDVGAYSSPKLQHPVSANGQRVFFTTNRQLNGDVSYPAAVKNLYVWDAGTSHLLSRQGGPSGPAADVDVTFEWAAQDGHRAFFSTAAQLDVSATAGVRNVYAVDVPSGALHLISSGAASDAALVAASDNGAHALFWTTSQLPGTTAPAGSAPKLYLWDGSATKYVADLPAGDPLTKADVALRPVRSTPDGSVFAFATTAKLAGDTNDVADVFRVGADGVPALVSRRPSGDASSPAVLGATHGSFGVLPDIDGRSPGRAVTDDGSTVFFTAADALTPDAGANGRQKVYAAGSDGSLTLISPAGPSADDAWYQDNSPDGRDVYFESGQSIVSRDIDGGWQDLYDARLGGGFPEPPASGATVGSPPPSRGPAGPPSAAPPPTTIADSQGAVPPQAPKPAVPSPDGALRIHGGPLRAHGRTVTLTVDVPGSGSLRTQMMARATRVTGHAAHQVSEAGAVSVRLRLSRAGYRHLLERGQVRATIAVTFTVADGTSRTAHRTVTVRSDRIHVLDRALRLSGNATVAFVAVPERGAIGVQLRRGSSLLARGRQTSRSGGRIHVRVRLTAAGRAALDRGDTIRAVQVTSFSPTRRGHGLSDRARVHLSTTGVR